MTHPEFRTEFTEIIGRWNSIERRIKEPEQVCGNAVVAAINELRYAGRQFVDAVTIYVQPSLTTDDVIAIRKHLQNVQYNLMNADHDCTDAICMFFHERVKRISDEYGVELIVKHLPNYKELLDRMAGANKEISSSREDRQNRQEIYRALAEFHIPALYQFDNEILTSEPLMLAHKKRTRLLRNAGWVVSVILAVSLVALAYFYQR